MMMMKILNDDDDRMGSVLLLCYGNRAAIAAHRPIWKKNIWSSDDDRDDDHCFGENWDWGCLGKPSLCRLSDLELSPNLAMQLLHLDCQQTDTLPSTSQSNWYTNILGWGRNDVRACIFSVFRALKGRVSQFFLLLLLVPSRIIYGGENVEMSCLT